MLLGLLFGAVGFHNFYSGHYLRGGIKFGLGFVPGLVVTLVASVLGASTIFIHNLQLVVVGVVVVLNTLWSLVEIIVVKNDAAGNRMV